MARWWSRSRGLPEAAYDTWRASMAADPRRPTRILAWAEAVEGGYALASPAALSVSDAAGGWTQIGWHEIESGGWNAELRKLSWTRYADGDRPGRRHGAVELADPARLPEVFRERVAASIAVERFLPVSGERGVVLNGRRDLAESDPVIAWHATLGRGLTWRTPGLREVVDEALAELRREYDPHGPAELPRLDSNQQPAG